MEPPKTSLKRARPWAALAFTVLAVLGGTLVLLRMARDPAEPPPAAGARSEPEPPSSAVAPDAPSAGEASAADARSLLEAVSANPLFRSVLEGEPLRRWAVVIDNLAEGASPRRQLRFLAPSLPFTAAERGGVKVIDPASYRRYDAFADAVASVDAQALARAYRALRGALEAAYRGLGYPGASIDRAVARALDRIERVPVPEGDVALEEEGGVFVFRDPRLERLSDAEKHVVRMGPRNARLLQEKARELRRALAL
jgi:hypothetical protein